MEGNNRFLVIFLSTFLLFVGFLYFNHHEAPTQDHNGISAAELLTSLPSLLLRWLPPQSPTNVIVDDNDDDDKRLNDQNGSTIYPGLPLVTNLSSCGPSYSKGGKLVYCCPATDDASQPIIDFQFPDPSAPKRIRRPSHRLDPAYIAKYELAVSRMKALHPDHPHNFYRQANIHCLYCTGGYVQSNSTALYNIHRSWLFYPWHRAMIFFHERILGKLVDDDEFALNFWQWDTPEAMQIPEMYLNGSLIDTQRDEGHLPPAIVDLDFYTPHKNFSDEEQIEHNLAFMYHQMVSGAKKTELFMGCRTTAGVEGLCDGPGTVELAPHNTLHTWVGSPNRIERENMGTFYVAARDPVFYAHHGNIDRMWILWMKMNGDRPELNDPAWLDSEFYFYDENLQLVRVRVRDVIDYTKLGYDYEETTYPWLLARPKPSMSPTQSRRILSKMVSNSTHVLQMPTSSTTSITADSSHLQGGTLDKTIRLLVQRPKLNRTAKEKQQKEEVLVIFGIDTKGNPSKFDVFVNLVDETKASPKYREFAGTFVSLSHNKRIRTNSYDHDDTHLKGHIKLGIGELLEDLEIEGDENIMVTLIPRENESLTFEGIRIEYLS